MAVRTRVRGLEVAHPNAAGIDISSASHFVAVPPDRDDEPVGCLKKRYVRHGGNYQCSRPRRRSLSEAAGTLCSS